MIVALLLVAAASAPQERGVIDVRREVTALAFDPARFFDAGPDLVRIAYRGDDYDWPVWSIAIRTGCLPGAAREGCGERRIARMVRAALPQGAERPRQRGVALVTNVAGRKPADVAAVAAALDTAKVEWVEADLTTCPGALEALASASDTRWVPDGLAPAPSQDIMIVLHADRIRVEFPDHLRSATYDGWIAPGSPAEWANRFATLVEPCWKPAAAPPPWRKPLPQTQRKR
ncbi:hypothetical protein [Sphingomonas sp.]|uniref:hypothetical protein n=1 Tax=Sphingomonas sp. TaxID=28214 RepID=UPI002DD6647B|nr:hypothetical protein [Sphingomonas sp.]